MPRARRSTERGPDREAGSASIEFLTVGLLLLVPLVYLVLALAAVQGAALGVEGAARQASRMFVQAHDEASAESAAHDAISVALADYGMDAGGARVRIDCAPDPGDCLGRRGFVTVRPRAEGRREGRAALPGPFRMMRGAGPRGSAAGRRSPWRREPAGTPFHGVPASARLTS